MIVHDLVDAPIDRPCASMHGVGGGTVTVGTGQVCVGCNPIRGGRGRYTVGEWYIGTSTLVPVQQEPALTCMNRTKRAR